MGKKNLNQIRPAPWESELLSSNPYNFTKMTPLYLTTGTSFTKYGLLMVKSFKQPIVRLLFEGLSTRPSPSPTTKGNDDFCTQYIRVQKYVTIVVTIYTILYVFRIFQNHLILWNSMRMAQKNGASPCKPCPGYASVMLSYRHTWTPESACNFASKLEAWSVKKTHQTSEPMSFSNIASLHLL